MLGDLDDTEWRDTVQLYEEGVRKTLELFSADHVLLSRTESGNYCVTENAVALLPV